MSYQSHAFIDAYRHAFAMGFATTIILGVAQRVLPVWEGKTIYSGKLMASVFLLLLFGNIVRVLLQVISGSAGGPYGYFIAGGGFLQFAAVVFFSYNVWKTLDVEEEPIVEPVKDEKPGAVSEPPGAGTMFGPKTKVFEILHEHPGAKEVLENLGIKGLPDRESGRSVPKFLTLERICRSNGLETKKVIIALEEHCSMDRIEG